MLFEELQDGCHGGHLGKPNGKDLSNSESLCRSTASHFGSIRLTIWEDMSFEEFEDGHHLGYRNGMILAILNRYVAPMPPIKFLLNLTYG